MPETAVETAHKEYLRSDDPPVRGNGDASRSCLTCGHWTQWLSDTGDCLLYAHRRRVAFDGAEGAEEAAAWRAAWPRRAARTTSAAECCDGWTRIGSDGR